MSSDEPGRRAEKTLREELRDAMGDAPVEPEHGRVREERERELPELLEPSPGRLGGSGR